MLNNVSDDLRNHLIQTLMRAGMDRTAATEHINLAAHAVNSAIEKVKTVCATGSRPQTVWGAHSLALAMLSTVAKAHSDIFDEQARQAAEAAGIKVVMPSELDSEGEPPK